MWWPSFLSVVHDLWRFIWRQDVVPAGPVSSSGANNMLVTSANVAQPPVKPLFIQEQPKAPITHIQLEPKVTYTEESTATISIRKHLHDKGIERRTVGNLQLQEWLAYEVTKRTESISPLPLMMSPLGRWHQTLKGQPGIQIGIEPATNALIEWFDSSLKGYAGIIQKVTPDNTLTFKTVSRNPDGTCVEETLSEVQWRNRGAVFTRLRL